MKTFTLLGGKLTFIDEKPRPPEDALWLAATMPRLPEGARVLDAGCGSGVAGLALTCHQPHIHLAAVDIDEGRIALAAKHAKMNSVEIETSTTDITLYKRAAKFDAVMCNPPFHAAARGHSSAREGRAKTLQDNMLTAWLVSFANLLTVDGVIHLIVHTACREEIEAFAKRGWMMMVAPLLTRQNKPAKRLLVTLMKGLVVVMENPPISAYEEKLRERVLKRGAALT